MLFGQLDPPLWYVKWGKLDGPLGGGPSASGMIVKPSSTRCWLVSPPGLCVLDGHVVHDVLSCTTNALSKVAWLCSGGQLVWHRRAI
jgi:hypothetical protein